MFHILSPSWNSLDSTIKLYTVFIGNPNRKYRITVPAFPYLRILPGRSEGRPAARTGERGVVHEERENIGVCEGWVGRG